MPSIFFGYQPKRHGATKLAVDTPAGQLEPAEPSTFRIYATPEHVSQLFQTVRPRLGHLIVVTSQHKYTFLPLGSQGDFVNPATVYLPFRTQNFGFVVSKEIGLTEAQTAFLEASMFTSMRYQNKTVWLREGMTKDMFVEVVGKEIAWEDTGAVPARYLNPQSFRALLSTLSLTSRICETFHKLSSAYGSIGKPTSGMNEIAGCKASTEYEDDPDVPSGPSNADSKIAFTKPSNGNIDAFSKLMSTFLLSATPLPPNPLMSVVVVNQNSDRSTSFIPSGDMSFIRSPGKIFKFEPKLATPDVNIIADTIGHYFLSSLGTTHVEQFSNLQMLKSGLGALRLTEVGDELAHLYKCIGLAVEGQCGLVPFFSGSFYEGCVFGGGHGTVFCIGDHVSRFESVENLKDEYLTASSHGQSLAFIANKVPADVRANVLRCVSMVELRNICLPLSLTPDDRDYIVQKASTLRFSQTHWVISPNNLRRCFLLISNLSQHLTPDCPISRVTLFSKDPVLIALSVFGERSAPSLNIPNGTLCSAKSPNPPSLPKAVNKGSNSNGQTSDAAWVMTVRKTDLMSAVEDFKLLSETQSYRSLSSVLAKKQGFHSFSRDRMAEFWNELRTAYRQVNPSFLLDELEKSLKRSGQEAGVGESAGVAPKKSRTLGF
jgi:hypothetical protein